MKEIERIMREVDAPGGFEKCLKDMGCGLSADQAEEVIHDVLYRRPDPFKSR